MRMSSPANIPFDPHAAGTASQWVRRWSHLVAPQGTVLDVACGQGRHLRWFARRQHPVTGVDKSAEAIAVAARLGEAVLADIENGPWPFLVEGKPRQFAAVLVTNYLWRPLFPTLLQSLAWGGVLIYETFAAGNETVGKPSRTDFLLQPGELLQLCQGLRIVAFEEGFLDAPTKFVQRVVAVREPLAPDQPRRYPLAGHPGAFPG